MAFKHLLILFLAVVVLGKPEAKPEADPKADPKPALVAHHGTHYHSTPKPHYGYTPAYNPTIYGPTYHSVTPSYHHVTPVYPAVTPGYAVTPAYPAVTPYPPVTPAYPVYPSPQPAVYHTHEVDYKCHGYESVPKCSYNTTKPWCLYDKEYPEYDIKEAIHYHKAEVLSLYADVADLSRFNSVDLPRYLDETYLCPSEIGYVRPLRAINTDGYWRIIVNNIKVDYEIFTQTTRIEECLSYGPCPLVPHCHESKCLQKSIYHRFLVYDPCDKYFPFAIETFKLPSTCACLLGAFFIGRK
ncbi:protein spaetzle-like [Macrobrachium nipponense]|uniref:protein spaetzle-like n=1 Tax=Macrobrachium nipponense TaxID=159736 RepID=UPI0030C8479B